MRKNLQHLKLSSKPQQENLSYPEKNVVTAEGIGLKQNYYNTDTENLEHLDFGAGFAPYLRGPLTTMYVQEPWAIKQNISFSTYKNHGNGQGHVAYDNKKAEITIHTVEDIKTLLEGIPVNEISVSMSIQGDIVPLMAFLIVAAKEQGIDLNELSGIMQNDILRDAMPHNSYTPTLSDKIITDVSEYCVKNMPKFNSVCISGYYIRQMGATADIELAYTLAQGLEHLRHELKRQNTGIDELAKRLSFCWAVGSNHFMEIAKMRAGRLLWAKLLKEFSPKDEKSMALLAHSQTSEESLTQQDPFNNVTRTCIGALAAVFGGAQSIDTGALHNSANLPADPGKRLADNTQHYLLEETKITKTVDPWAGSYYIESLTNGLVLKAWTLIEEVEAFGGITKAIEAGIPQRRVEEAATRKQARIDSGEDSIVGSNKYRLHREDLPKEAETDNQAVSSLQTAQPEIIKAYRNNDKVTELLNKLTACAKTGEGNLLEIAIEAAEYRATLPEINKALEKADE